MIAGPSPSAEQPVLHREEEVMGTVVTFDLFLAEGEPRPGTYHRLANARSILQRADAVFSTWKPDSPISRLRRGELTLESAPAVVAEVLEACRMARDISEGWFDPWAMPGGVDPTGYVKGWAAQRALEALVADELTGGIVNAAGDIASFGGRSEGRPFRVGIADPRSPRRLACVVELTGALATSGTYERGAHLVDPRTGEARAGAASASVCGGDLGLADALATALAVAGEEGLGFIAAAKGYEAMVIREDGSRVATPGFPFAAEE